MTKSLVSDIELAWQDLQQQVLLSDKQMEQLKRYYDLLIAWNEQMNLTTITEPRQMIAYHLHDSLKVGDFFDMQSIRGMADVGTGGGFPGVPLKIKYPHLTVYLVEVNHKKIRFLESVIKELGLMDMHLIDLDWRTFLRKTSYPIDLFCARASLAPEELIRMFKPSSPYNSAMLIYWASTTWHADSQVEPFVIKEEPYGVGNKRRKFVFLGKASVLTAQ